MLRKQHNDSPFDTYCRHRVECVSISLHMFFLRGTLCTVPGTYQVRLLLYFPTLTKLPKPKTPCLIGLCDLLLTGLWSRTLRTSRPYSVSNSAFGRTSTLFDTFSFVLRIMACRNAITHKSNPAPPGGFKPPAFPLTAGRSVIELRRIVRVVWVPRPTTLPG